MLDSYQNHKNIPVESESWYFLDLKNDKTSIKFEMKIFLYQATIIWLVKK